MFFKIGACKKRIFCAFLCRTGIRFVVCVLFIGYSFGRYPNVSFDLIADASSYFRLMNDTKM